VGGAGIGLTARRTAELLDYLTSQRLVLEAAWASVPGELRARSPAPERWSAAQVLAHLAIVERRVLELLRTRIAAARAAGLAPEHDTSSVLASFDMARLVHRDRRVTTGAASQPPPDADAAVAWTELADVHASLRDLLATVDGLAIGHIVAPHPVFGPLNAYHWLVFVAGHEGRHAAQMRETLAILTHGPDAPAEARCSGCGAVYPAPGEDCTARFEELLALDHSRREPWGSRHGLAAAAFTLQHSDRHPRDMLERAWLFLHLVYERGADRAKVARGLRRGGRRPPDWDAPPLPTSTSRPSFAVTIADLGTFPAATYPVQLDAWCRAALAGWHASAAALGGAA
jgi:Family of unknown function (DUF5946)/DinB superfamily